MNIELPTIPAGVLVLLAVAAPYVQALIQRPSWPSKWKKAIAVALALVLTGMVLVFYYVYTGDTVPAWPALALLAIVVAQASYSLVTKNTANAVEHATSPTAVTSQKAKTLGDSIDLSANQTLVNHTIKPDGDGTRVSRTGE